jgi:polyferredoxin
LRPEERVLSTLNADGSRRWLTPRISAGRFWKRRRVVAWMLIAFFVALPHIHLNGRQFFFLNIAAGEFTIFGKTFIRTDTLLLALFMIVLFVAVFLLTALFGRVWCGWGCPQTVYLEFVFRPIERLFDGKRNKPGVLNAISALPARARRIGKWSVYALFAFFIANTFLAYFVGSEPLRQWITSSPAEHPFGFGVVVFVTALMLFDFGFFREQLCIVACPYGRMQSVLLDQHSLIVGYDAKRGEPRGHLRRGRAKADVPLRVLHTAAASGGTAIAGGEGEHDIETGVPGAGLGDCIDCGNCVKVCPTGIDIRDGLQLECIHCTQCIDACDDVMHKIGREPGLIRYATQASLESGRWRMFRPRVVLYPLVLALALGLLVALVGSKSSFDAAFIRGEGLPFYTLPSGEITNQGRIRITNRTREARAYSIEGEGLELRTEANPIDAGPGETVSERVLLVMPREFFAGTDGHRVVVITVRDDQGRTRTLYSKLVGPVHGSAEGEKDG